jgi:CheY-like chemotaxis protein
MAAKRVVTLPFHPRTMAVGSGAPSDDRGGTGGDAHSKDGQYTEAKLAVKSIAVVDDEEELRLLFSMVVRSLGYRLELAASDGDAVVKAVLEGSVHPDLILMDQRMPIMHGLEAAERIRRAKPWIKIIMTTADDSVSLNAKAAGFLFIEKPFSISALRKTIEQALDR